MDKHLTQTTYECMSCPYQYGLVHIEGQKPPDTLPSVRGRDIHQIMAAYSEHCSARRVPMDLSYFDGLLMDTGEDAAAIMHNAGESIKVDWQNFFAAEVSMGLDEDFKPTYSIDHDGNVLPFRNDLWGGNASGSDKKPMVCGIADDIALFPGGRAARIRDYKSHPRPFEPTTFQAKLYALMLFMHMPELQEIEFVLVFVRYTNIVRPIKFHRDHVPTLKDEVRRVRNRQIEYHATYQQEGLQGLAALPGTHCTYCPAISSPDKCPISRLNPMMELEGNKRLQYRLWYSAMSRANNQIMSQMVEGTGNPIHAQDANGKTYTFGPVEVEEVTYPLFVWNGGGFDMPILDALQNWMDTAPEDCLPSKRSPVPWLAKLRIGATELNQYLKANKREVVHNNIKDLAERKNVVQFKVQRDAEVDDAKGEEYQTFNHRDPQGDNLDAAGWEP
jgi:PD-(D/E)XK nuclease superfamily